MVNFDENEIKIVKELIKNPRVSDNQIGKNTGIPVKTVNRKRKLLEQNNIIHYFTHVNHGIDGTKHFSATQLFIIKFKHGITRLTYLDKIKEEYENPHIAKHIPFSYLGESGGKLNLIFAIGSLVDSDILEILNADIIPFLKKNFGEDCIEDVQNITLTKTLRLHHNYFPIYNMENGKLKQNWPGGKIFVV